MLKKIKGFTIIEIMIVVAIVGIIAAIAIPNYQAYKKKAAVKRIQEAAAQFQEQSEVEFPKDPMKLDKNNSYGQPKFICMGGYVYIVYGDTIIQHYEYDRLNSILRPVECEGGYECTW